MNATDRFGRTPVHGAAIFGWNDVIQTLVEAGADPSAADQNDDTPLDYARGEASGRFRGVSYEVHDATAALLEELIAERRAALDAPTDAG